MNIQTFHPYRFCLAALAVAALFTGCSDEDERHEAGHPITFIPSIRGVSEGALTRAANKAWASGDAIGVYMVNSKADIDDINLASNVQYKTVAAGENVSLTPVGTPISYPTNNNVNFVAYYPYKAAVSTAHTYAVDVATQTTPANIDLLYHKGTTDYNLYTPTVEMNFKHQLSKIIINISRESNVTTALTDASVSITGMPTTATFALKDAKFSSLGNVKAISPEKITANSSASAYQAEAIVIPHTGTGYTRYMVFSIAGTTIKETLPIPTATTFESGKAYTYHMVLNTNGVNLKEVTITDWGDANTTTYAESSNCYILKPGGNTVVFPVSRANEFAQQLGETDAFTAEVLWSDAANLITLTKSGTGYKGNIHVTSGSKTTVGNAVVVLKKGTTILWSWHIWVVDYEPTTTWMDRNLGATSNVPADGVKTYGLYYQWGRKDPFPGTAANSAGTGKEPTLYNSAGTGFTYAMNTANVSQLGSKPTLIKTSQSIAWTVQNPMTYIGVSGSWMTGSTSTDNPWNSGIEKSIYDPCPTGWRIHKDDPWASLTTANFPWTSPNKGGRTNASVGGWFPASGNRSSSASTPGELTGVGTNGYTWRSAVNNASTGSALAFASGSVTINSANNRAAGFPVRCVRE